MDRTPVMVPDPEAIRMREQVVRSKRCSGGECMKNKLSFRRPGCESETGSEREAGTGPEAKPQDRYRQLRGKAADYQCFEGDCFGNARPNADADLSAGTGSVPVAMRRIFRAGHWMTCVHRSAEPAVGTGAWMDSSWRSGCIDRLCASRSLAHEPYHERSGQSQ
jgi:hypothetical protein